MEKETKPQTYLDTKKFVNRLDKITQQGKALRFLLWVFPGLLIFTILVILFQGFNYYGFKLESSFLHWLGAATIGEIVGLGGVVYGALFRKDCYYDILRDVIRLFEDERIDKDTLREILTSSNLSDIVRAEQKRKSKSKLTTKQDE